MMVPGSERVIPHFKRVARVFPPPLLTGGAGAGLPSPVQAGKMTKLMSFCRGRNGAIVSRPPCVNQCRQLQNKPLQGRHPCHTNHHAEATAPIRCRQRSDAQSIGVGLGLAFTKCVLDGTDVSKPKPIICFSAIDRRLQLKLKKKNTFIRTQ